VALSKCSLAPFRSVSDCPGGINLPVRLGQWVASESPKMYSDSRKARHNSFAHHRAVLLFSDRLLGAGTPAAWSATAREGTENASELPEGVIAGLHGFVRSAVQAACAT
jgi:hypothetical protein